MDFTVRLGDVLTMIGLFGGGLVVIIFMRADMRILSTRVGSVETSFHSFSATVNNRLNAITEILVQQARHDQRIANMEQRLLELERGPP